MAVTAIAQAIGLTHNQNGRQITDNAAKSIISSPVPS